MDDLNPPPVPDVPLLSNGEQHQLRSLFSQDFNNPEPLMNPHQQLMAEDTSQDYYSLPPGPPPPSVHQVSTVNPYFDGLATVPSDFFFNEPTLSQPFAFGSSQASSSALVTNSVTFDHSPVATSAYTPTFPAYPSHIPQSRLDDSHLSYSRHNSIHTSSNHGARNSNAGHPSHPGAIQHPQQAAQRIRPSVAYGTDKSFNSSGYKPEVPNAERATVDRLQQDVTTAFQLNSHLEGTNAGRKLALAPKRPRNSQSYVAGNVEQEVGPAGARHRSVSSQLTETFDTDDMGSEDLEGEAGAKRRKLSSVTSPGRRPSSVSSPGNKKPSNTKRSPGGKKKPGLTLEEKKRNHVDSERRRRDRSRYLLTSIKELIPSLTKGLNKAKELAEIAKYIRELRETNEKLDKLSRAPDG